MFVKHSLGKLISDQKEILNILLTGKLKIAMRLGISVTLLSIKKRTCSQFLTPQLIWIFKMTKTKIACTINLTRLTSSLEKSTVKKKVTKRRKKRNQRVYLKLRRKPLRT